MSFQSLVPKQLNSWDCGVFVCRYAYSMLLLRHNEFTFSGSDNARGKCCMTSFKNLIKSDAFRFNLDDIARLRDEIRTLIERLSELYLDWKARNATRNNEESKKPPASPAEAELVRPWGITNDRTTEESVLLESASETNDARKDISRDEDRDNDRKPASTDSPATGSTEPKKRLDPPGKMPMDREVRSSQDEGCPLSGRNEEPALISSIPESLLIVQDETGLAGLESEIQELAIENGPKEKDFSPQQSRTISHGVEVEKDSVWHESAKLAETLADPYSMVAEI
jgi:hypothetical protein